MVPRAGVSCDSPDIRGDFFPSGKSCQPRRRENAGNRRLRYSRCDGVSQTTIQSRSCLLRNRLSLAVRHGLGFSCPASDRFRRVSHWRVLLRPVWIPGHEDCHDGVQPHHPGRQRWPEPRLADSLPGWGCHGHGRCRVRVVGHMCLVHRLAAVHRYGPGRDNRRDADIRHGCKFSSTLCPCRWRNLHQGCRRRS